MAKFTEEELVNLGVVSAIRTNLNAYFDEYGVDTCEVAAVSTIGLLVRMFDTISIVEETEISVACYKLVVNIEEHELEVTITFTLNMDNGDMKVAVST